MTIHEIAIFKRFIGQHELRKNFIAKYRKSIGLTRNPQSVEQYLANVEPEKVILNAVKHFITNEAMGFDFWQSVNESWLQFLKKMRSSHTIEQDNPINFRGYFSALRENWDKEKPWIYDPVSVAQLRYGLITEDQEPQEKTPVEPEQIQENDEPDNLEIDFVEIDRPARISYGLHSGIMSVNVRSHSWRIIINRINAKDIKAKSLKYAIIGTLKSGDTVIQFNNNSKGVPIVLSSEGYCNINSKQFVKQLRSMLAVTDDLVYLRIEKIAEKMDSITYKVTKQ